MKNIQLPTVIVPESTITDMTEDEQKYAKLVLTKTEFKNITPEQRLLLCIFNPFGGESITGSTPDKAISLYRNKKGYPNVSITAIPYSAIFAEINDTTYLSFAAQLLFRIDNRAQRLQKLLELDAPAIIIRNETRILRELIDTLLIGDLKDSGEFSLKTFGYTIIGSRLVKIAA